MPRKRSMVVGLLTAWPLVYLAFSAAWLACPVWSPPRADGRTSSRWARPGTKITPELYLACGISGAIQHIAGCVGGKHIIAINTDSGAPIMAHADYASIGDPHQVIPAPVATPRALWARSLA